MNTATAPIKEIGNVIAQPRPATPQDDPRAMKWGYGAGLYQMNIPALQSGQQQGNVEQGVFVGFDNFTIATDSANLEQSRVVAYGKDGRALSVATDVFEVKAQEAILSVKDAFASPDKPKGFIELTALAGKRDLMEIGAIEYLANPPFKEIIFTDGEHESAFVCPERLEVCPTCRLEIIDKYASARIEQNAAQFNVDAALCKSVLQQMRVAVVNLLAFYNEQWTAIKGDLESAKNGKVGLYKLTPEHTYIRRCLHESAPEEKQAQIQSAYAEVIGQQMANAQRENNQAFAEAIKSIGSGSDDKVLMLFEQMQADNRRRDEMFIEAISALKQNPAQQAEKPDAPKEQPKPKTK